MMVNRHIERLLDKLLPKGPASQTQRMENNSDRGVAKAE
jgi:hypothetical protein